MNQGRVACKVDDRQLVEKGWKSFECFGGKVCLVIKDGEAYRGYVNRCPHANGEAMPAIDDEGNRVLKCMLHGSLFNITTGEALTAPAAPGALRSLSLTVEDGIIYYS